MAQWSQPFADQPGGDAVWGRILALHVQGRSSVTLIRGGHFPVWEEPQLFSQEVRAAFRSLR